MQYTYKRNTRKNKQRLRKFRIFAHIDYRHLHSTANTIMITSIILFNCTIYRVYFIFVNCFTARKERWIRGVVINFTSFVLPYVSQNKNK